ncbi:MAG TPA: hypothetical protein VMB53_16900, partial [Gaiellaceae bacterium]|nr:hypothetical protein [Gaiellaceae bacterium]
VGIGIIVDVVNKDVNASIGDPTAVEAGGDVTVSATATEQFLEIAVEAAASEDAGVAGSVIVLVMNEGGGSPGTRASIGAGSVVHAKGNVTVAASDTADQLQLYAGNVTVGGSAGVGVSSAVLVRSGIVDAGIGAGADIQAWGATGLTVTATQEENVVLLAIGGSVGGDAGVAGSVTVDALSNQTFAHIDDGTTVNLSNGGAAATEGVAVAATDSTTIDGIAGALAIGGDAGIGAGVDVEVVSKDTEAWIGDGVTVNAKGNFTVDATSSENVISISVGAGFSGSVAVTVNAGVSVFGVTTKASVGDGATVNVGGSARVAANEALVLSVIAGNLSGSGSAAVGAAGAVPVVNKTTTASVGDGATVNALGGGSGLSVNTGAFDVTLTDTRFAPSTAIEGDGKTIDLGYTHGFKNGQQVLYDNGGGADIGGLTGGNVYYVIVVSPHEVRLATTNANALAGTAIALTAPVGGGESQRLVPTNQAGVRQNSSDWFDPAADVSGNVIALPYSLSVADDDPVVYSSGGGTPIGGLVDGGTYYAHVISPNHIALRATKGGADIVLNAAAATGRSHSLVKQGDQPSADASEVTGTASVAPSTTGGFKGVAVTATNSDNVAGVGVSAAISGGVSVGLSGTVQIVSNTTSATVGKSAKINVPNLGADPDQSVLVAAGSVFHQILVAASIAGGEVGVGASVTVGVVTENTDAKIDDSATVNAAKNVVVAANGQETIISVGASG